MGSLPDYPGHRWMYDQDGTLTLMAYSQNGSLGATDLSVINDENAETYANDPSWNQTTEYVWIFPELRDLKGLHIGLSTTTSGFDASRFTMFTSSDTVDGMDGTWTQYGPGIANALFVSSTNWRSNILAVNVPGIKAIKIRYNAPNSNPRNRLAMVHFYGDIAVTSNPNRLEFWAPTTDAMLGPMGLDFPDIPAGSQLTKRFRLKNLSSTRTATNTVVSRDNAPGATVNAPMLSGVQFSLNATDWTNTVTIASLAPGAISPIIYIRRVVPSNEVAAQRAVRVKAVPTNYAA